MAYDIPPPKRLPQPGYYYQFKHDPHGPVNNYAYYIYGVGHHTKTIAEPKMPSCKSTAIIRGGVCLPERLPLDLRPLHMF